MALLEKSSGNPGKEDDARLINGLLYNARTRDLMKAQRIHSAVNHGGLTVAFLPNKDFPKSQLFSGLDHFLGNAHCAGIRLLPEKDLYDVDKIKKAYAGARHSLDAIVRQDNLSLGEDTRIALVTADDMRHWLVFEKEVASTKLEKTVGAKVWSYSGLRRLDPDRYQGQVETWRNLLTRKNAYLQSHGVTYKEEKGSEGIGVFVDRNGKYKPIPLCHVKERTSKRASEIVTEVIHDEPVLCPAVIIRALGESKNEAYDRSRQLAAHFKKTNGWTNIHIPIVSAGQLSAWEKLGFDKPSDTYISSVPVSWMELVRYTHLQKDNLHPGPLARLGISMPSVRKAHQHGVDIIFEKRVGLGSKGVTLDGVLSIVKDAAGKDVVKPINRVGAVIIGPANISADEMKRKYIYPAQQLLKRDVFSHESQSVNIAYVTPALFKQWKTQGMFAAEDKIKKRTIIPFPKPVVERTRWGKRTAPSQPKPRYEMSLLWQQRQVGFQRTLFRVDNAWYIGDWGDSFDEGPIAFRSLIGRERTGDGILRKLKHGIAPLIPGIYSVPLLEMTADGYIGLLDNHVQDTVSRFIRSELIHRVPEEDLVSRFGEAFVRKLYQFRDDEKFWYDQNYYLAGYTVSHAHVDHVGLSYLLGLASGNKKVPVFMSEGTYAFFEAMDHRARDWRNKYLTDVDPDPAKKKGSAYLKTARDIHLLRNSGETVRFPDGFWFQSAPVDHSIDGALAYLYGFPNGVQVFCSYDIKAGPLTDKMVHQFAGKPDILKMEATNLPTGEKTSMTVTEDDVSVSLQHEFQEANKAAIMVEISPNNIQRLLRVIAAAEAVGRQVVVDYDIAEYLRAQSELAARQDGGGKSYLPELGPQLGLWKRRVNPMPYHKGLIEHAQKYGAVVDPQRFQSESEKFVVVTTPYRNHEQDMKIGWFPHGIVLIHSAPYLYKQEGIDAAKANKDYIESLHGKYRADFELSGGRNKASIRPIMNPKWPLHASGHAQLVDNRPEGKRQTSVTDYLMTLLGPQRKGKIVIFDHTESGKKAVEAVKKDMKGNTEGIIFVDTINKYDVKVPGSGYHLGLDR